MSKPILSQVAGSGRKCSVCMCVSAQVCRQAGEKMYKVVYGRHVMAFYKNKGQAKSGEGWGWGKGGGGVCAAGQGGRHVCGGVQAGVGKGKGGKGREMWQGVWGVQAGMHGKEVYAHPPTHTAHPPTHACHAKCILSQVEGREGG